MLMITRYERDEQVVEGDGGRRPEVVYLRLRRQRQQAGGQAGRDREERLLRRHHYLRRWFGLSGDGCGTICPEHPEIHGKESYSGRTRHETDDLCHERPLISASLAETTALGVVSIFLLSLK